MPKVPATPKIPRTPNLHGLGSVRRRRGRGSRAVILALLVAATVGGVLFAAMRPSSFDVTTVRVGDFVKVDGAGHITGKISEPKAATTASGRRVTAREDQADPEVCKKFHVAGHPDVETKSSVSFCLVHPGAAASEPQQ
jgi:hypothetical protein